MNRCTQLLGLLAVVLFTASCTSTKVLETWTSPNLQSARDTNILVIARTAHEPSRKAFESAMVSELEKKGITATASYKKFPNIDPDRKLTEAQVEEYKTLFKEQGYNGVVVSVLKNVQELTDTKIEGGYVAGQSIGSYYGVHAIGFFGYYTDPRSYSTYDGVEVEQTFTTERAYIYTLQTAVYNLDLDPKDQLLAVVTSKIDQPEYIPDNAMQYAKAVGKAIKNN